MGGAVTSSATDGGEGGTVGTEGTVTSGSGQGGTGGTGNSFDVCSTPPPQGTRVVTIHVIGDSTASIYGSDLYPRTGWGQVLGDYYSPACAVVNDKALSGRSSKSFYDEGAWTPVRDALVEGDFVLIQFGHNDEKSDDPTRYTDPQTTYKQYLTTYITDARARNATPVLLTPINRNNWNGTTLKDTHGDYPPAMRELASDLDVALIDLTALTKMYFESLGPETTSDLFMNLDPGEFPNYPDGNSDNTHLREAGARVIAELLDYDAYSQQLPLGSLLASVPSGP
jgi:lysophospholipase L1-like esterase